jgi:hypothetical protein
MKFIGTGPNPFHSSFASSPVFSAYLRGYWKETPEATSLYVTVDERFFVTFFDFSAGTELAGSAGVEAATGAGVVICEVLLDIRLGSFDFEQPTTTDVTISKLAITAVACLPLSARPDTSSGRASFDLALCHLKFSMLFHLRCLRSRK